MITPAQVIRRLQEKYLHTFDPAALALRRTAKTMAAMAVGLALLYPLGRPAVWAALAAMFLSQVPPGLSLAKRRRAMLLLVAASTLLMLPATLLGTGVFKPAIVVVLVAFVAFLTAALGPAYGACSLWALLLTVIALGNPGGWEQALIRAGAVATGGMLAFVSHFVLFPLRPGPILHNALDLALDNLGQVFDLVQQSYESGEIDEPQLDRAKDRALTSLHRFRRLPQFLELLPGPGDHTQNAILSLGLNLVRVYENLLALWQLRQSAGDSGLFAEALPSLTGLTKQTRELFKQLARAATTHDLQMAGEPLLQEIQDDLAAMLARRKQAGEAANPRGRMLVFNSLYALESLARDLERADDQHRQVALMYPKEEPALDAASILRNLAQELRWDSPHLRRALQAAAAAGAAMFLVKFFNLHYGYWVVVFALLVVKPDLGSSIKMGKKRTIGTLLGAGGAIVFLLLLANSGVLYFTVLGMGVFGTLYLMNFSRPLLSSVVTTFTMVLLISSFSYLGWKLGLLRAGETTLAVAIGLTAAMFLWPNRAGERLRGEMARGLEGCAKFFAGIFEGFMAGGLDTALLGRQRQELQQTLAQARDTLEATRAEPGTNPELARNFGELNLVGRRIFDLLLTLEAAASQSSHRGRQQAIKGELRAFAGQVEDTLDRLAQALTQKVAVPELPGLLESVQVIHGRLGVLKQERAGHQPPLDDLLNLSAFLWGVRALAMELDTARQAVDGLAQN